MPLEDPPLRTDLGDSAWPIDTNSREAQQYFDQGMRWFWAFNFPASVESFVAAQHLDKKCAMCFYGEALALGANLNWANTLPPQMRLTRNGQRSGTFDPKAVPMAFDAVTHAQALLDSHTPALERALISALAVRYSKTVALYQKEKHNHAKQFAADMEKVWRSPSLITPASKANVGALTAEALMDLTPWDYWLYTTRNHSAWQQMGSGRIATPRPNAAKARRILEEILRLDSTHPGACHLYIHLMEASGNATAAVPAALALGGGDEAETTADPASLESVMLGSPHMNHMPSHIFIHTGEYEQGAVANRRAIAVGNRDPPDAMYPEHNRDFLVWLLRMQGNCSGAVQAAAELSARGLAAASLAPADREAGFSDERFAVALPLTRVACRRWQEILAAGAALPEAETPEAEGSPPPATLHYTRAVWHFSRGMAQCAQGAFAEAVVERDALHRLVHGRGGEATQPPPNATIGGAGVEAAAAAATEGGHGLRNASLYSGFPALQLADIQLHILQARMDIDMGMDMGMGASQTVNRRNIDRDIGISAAVPAPEIGTGELRHAHAHAQAPMRRALQRLRRACELEDALPYDEPPAQFLPTRLYLGEALLRSAGVSADDAGWQEEAKGARLAFEENLRRYPRNGWGLWGLHRTCLVLQDRDCSEEALAQFQKAWVHADFPIEKQCPNYPRQQIKQRWASAAAEGVLVVTLGMAFFVVFLLRSAMRKAEVQVAAHEAAEEETSSILNELEDESDGEEGAGGLYS